MLKKNDKSGQYDDSDDDKNPYASSVCCRSSFPFSGRAHPYMNRRKRMMNLIRLRSIRDLRFRPHRLAQDHSSQVQGAAVLAINQTTR
jgi:hypothetical protein